MYCCNMRNAEYEDKLDASVCEKEHMDRKDHYYDEYATKISFEKLKRASEHPEQRKLI